MSRLPRESRFADPDRAYRAIAEAHRGLSEEESARLDARLVLILANALGDEDALDEAIALAKASMTPSAERGTDAG